jgi:MFS family permease
VIRDLRRLETPHLVLAAITFVSSLGIGVMLPLIPLYARSLGASPLQLGLLTSGFAVANAVGQLSSGWLSDRVGARRFIRAGIATYAGANVLIASAANAVVLIAFRALAGLGAGIDFVATRLYLTQVSDPNRLALYNGVLSAVYSTGQVAGPAFGGLVAMAGGLRLPFLIVGLCSSIAFLCSLLLPRPVTGATPATAAVDDGARGLVSGPAAVLLLSQALLLAGYGAFVTTYAPLATTVLGWSTAEVGIVFSIFGAGSILLGPPLSGLADRTGHRRVASLACLPVTLFGVTLVLGFPRPVLYAVTFLAGGSITAYGAAWFAMLARVSPVARRGRTFGVVSAGSNLGMVFGAMTASAIWQRAGLREALAFASVPVALAGATLLLLPSERGDLR